MHLRVATRYFVGNQIAKRTIRSALRNGVRDSFVGKPLAASLDMMPDGFSAVEQRRWRLLTDRSMVTQVQFDHPASSPYQRPVFELARSSKNPTWGRFLYALTRSLCPANVLELGTCVGISGAYVATALKENGHGRLITMEGNPASAKLAEQTFRLAGLSNLVSVVVGPFQSTLDGVLRDHPSFDLVFIDGHHQREATIRYFKRVLPHLTNAAVVLLDDIRWSAGMLEAWNEIRNISGFEAVDIGAVGALRRGQIS